MRGDIISATSNIVGNFLKETTH